MNWVIRYTRTNLFFEKAEGMFNSVTWTLEKDAACTFKSYEEALDRAYYIFGFDFTKRELNIISID